MRKGQNFFEKKKRIIGMVHVQALPGTPLNKFSIRQIIDMAKQDAEIYINNGIDSIMMENMHDIPYLNTNVGPEITASMTAIASEIRKMTDLPLGIQILAGANKEALSVAQASDLQYIRAEGFVFSHIADEGLMNSCAGDLLRFRKSIGADDIRIFTDIKKKHSSHALTADISLLEMAKAAKFFFSDGIIITGTSTGEPAKKQDLQAISEINLPRIIGSGIDNENIKDYWLLADAFIVGTYFKIDRIWQNAVSDLQVKKMMSEINKLRSNE